MRQELFRRVGSAEVRLSGVQRSTVQLALMCALAGSRLSISTAYFPVGTDHNRCAGPTLRLVVGAI